MTTARQIAADVLHRSRSREAFAAELIDDAVTSTTVSPQDRRFVTQLVNGVIRRRANGAAHGGDGRQEDAAGPENAGGVAQRRPGIVDELQRLGEDEAVVAAGRDRVGRGKIGHDGGLRVGRIDVEHVGGGYVAAEAAGVVGVLDLEDPAPDVAPVGVEEALDVVAVYRGTSIGAPLLAQWRETAQRAEPGRCRLPPSWRFADWLHQRQRLSGYPGDHPLP